MSGLISDLSSAARALGAQQAGVEVAGRNLANVNTPGYSRESVQLGDLTSNHTPYGDVGNGVEVLSIAQARDQFLDAAVTREGSATSLLQAQQSALQQAQSALGETIDGSSSSGSINSATSSGSGVSSALNNFFNAFDELASSPTDTGAKQVLLQKAGTLADTVNVTDQRLSSLQSDLTSQVSTGVTSVNTLLSQIANLNGSISKIEVNAPGSALALRDQRQTALEQLSNYMDFTASTIPGSNGQIQITAQDTTGAGVTLLSKTTVNGGLSFNGTTISGGSPATALGLQGGSLQGQLSARDGAIQQLRDNLKAAANQVTTAVNGVYSTTGANFFQAAPASGLMAVDPALNVNTLKTSASGDAGANDVALSIAGLASHSFSTASGDAINGTMSGFFSQTVSGFGASLSGVNSQLENQQLVQKMTTQQRDSVSGVSMDEEMADLMKYQRAYQASSRVVTTMDDMLNTLINVMT